MKTWLFLLGTLLSLDALAYSAAELREDCLAAEEVQMQKKNSDPLHAIRAARCISYVAGFADGYGVGDYLADKVGVQLGAICLPKDDANLAPRLVRSVLAHLDRQPPNISASTATLVASALAKTFPCGDGKK